MKRTELTDIYKAFVNRRFFQALSATALLVVASLATAFYTGHVQALTPGTGAPTPVYRWFSNTDKDWVSIPAHGTQPSDAQLRSWGYTKTSTNPYYVSMIGTSDPNMVAVYRWWNPSDKDWVDIRNGSPSDSTLTSWGYTQKTFQYYAYGTSATGRVAINRWYSSADKDWISIRQGEISDATMTSWGYTGKTLVAYASATQSPTGEKGYFPLGTPQSAVVPNSQVPGYHPHTMSVVDVNPSHNPLINKGYRYLGYYGHNECGSPPQQGIFIARTNDLNAPTWQQEPTPPKFVGTPPCRWASAVVDGSSIRLVVNQKWDQTITGQTSTDALNGQTFGNPTTFVSESGVQNGNPTLFRDPNNNRFYLYWYRHVNGRFEIRVKSSTTFGGLLGSGPTDIGTLVATSPETTAAPQMMYTNGKYYLAVEALEACSPTCHWKTRVLTGTSPTGAFYEIPGNPVYPDGAACVFQHVVGNVLHAYYCQKNDPDDDATWTLNHVTGDLTHPN